MNTYKKKIISEQTTLKVLDKNKTGYTQLVYQRVFHAMLSKLCVFDYPKGCGTNAPRQMLTDYRGALQTDGYKVYDHYYLSKDIKHLACWVCARRYFEKVLTQDKKHAT